MSSRYFKHFIVQLFVLINTLTLYYTWGETTSRQLSEAVEILNIEAPGMLGFRVSSGTRVES
jgi:uncharacterized membrane protein YjgN (DUF898 family)